MAPFTLPGFTEPLNFKSHSGLTTFVVKNGQRKSIELPPAGTGRDLFPSALCNSDLESGATLNLTTLREFNMLRFMNAITDKPDWHVKILDDTIANKWKAEALQQNNFSEAMAEYCIKELQWKVKGFQEKGYLAVYNGDVVKSDTAISDDLKRRLQAAVTPLETVPEKQKDYHPGSDGKVVDLVHPSLFPLVYGRSRILRDDVIGLDDCIDQCGKGEIIPVPPEEEAQDFQTLRYSWRSSNSAPYSRKFQWLPCDVTIKSNEEEQPENTSTSLECKITSYINNLHPHRHKELYGVIEEIIAATIPLWNATLLPASDRHTYGESERIIYSGTDYDPDPEELPNKPEQQPNETDDDYWERKREWLTDAKVRCLVHPEPEHFEPRPEAEIVKNHSLSFVKKFAKTGLQIIVKLATIELSPEKPTYDGGVWHVEGQLNEHICATALYYYSSENISESRLAFRQISDTEAATDISYEQDDHVFLSEIFGCEQNGPAIQDVGSVLCREGRLITFPNILQHKVAPFELADPTKPGHRKILALFLVDPNLHIISTSSVPPQRRDWWSDKLWADGGFGGLSREMHEAIVEGVDNFPLGMDEALALRLELMEERKSFEIQHSGAFESATEFSLCEH